MITIREWQTDDAKSLAYTLNNKKIMDNLRDGLPFPYTEKDALYFINLCLNADKNEQFNFAITYNGEVVGSIGATRQPNIYCRTAELGYYIGQPFWGKGITTAAVKQI